MVARNVINGLIKGSPSDGLETWSVPTISQIAALDAAAIGEQLFKAPLGIEDTATSQNSAWSGTIGFSLLGGVSPYETWRLITAGDPDSTSTGGHQTASVNRLDDFKNILFAVDAYRYATLQAIAGTGTSVLQEELVDRLASFVPKQIAIAAASGKISPLIQYVVKDTPISATVNAILDYGTDRFLAMIASVYTGRFVKEGENFTKDAYSFFSTITLEKNQNTVTKLIIDYEDWKASAYTDTNAGMAIRNSLKYLSAVVIEDPSLLANRSLDLYSADTGAGSITKNWLNDRTEMFERLSERYSAISSGVHLQQYSYTDIDSQYQATMQTGVANPLVIFGSNLGSSFSGAGKGDHLYGGAADDVINGLDGDDYIEGGLGNDHLSGGADADKLVGMEGNDTLIGGAGADYLEGGAGQDIYEFAIGDGSDTIYDSDHDGKLKISGDSAFTAFQTSPGSNTWITADKKYQFSLLAGSDNTSDLTVAYAGGQIKISDFRKDTFGITLKDYQAAPAPTLPTDGAVIYGDLQPADPDAPALDAWGNLITNPSAQDIDHNDRIYDTSGNTSIYGLGGNDVIIGKNGGDDLYDGGDGHDYIVADSGKDTIVGGADSDILFGGADNDFMTGDTVMTLDESLKQTESVNVRGDYVDAGDGDDIVIGSAANDVLTGGRGSDVISGGAGNDIITTNSSDDRGGQGAERFLGAVGFDWTTTVDGPFSIVHTQGWGDSAIELTDDDPLSTDTVYGGAGNDLIYGGIGVDILNGGADDDFVFGNGGNDIIDGGTGNDSLYGDGYQAGDGSVQGNDFLNGGDGNDTLVGGAADDRLFGGDGDDTLAGDYVKSFGPSDILNGNDYLSGGLGNDTLLGGGGADTLYGDDGNDKLYGDFAEGPQGDDYLDGGAGDDLILGLGGDDKLYGGAGNDTIHGDASELDGSLAGNDWIDAGEGDDYVLGGGGSDLLYGGNGNDTLAGDDVALDAAYQGDDYIDGGAGDDNILGQGGNDTLLGGSGADLIHGGDGNNYIEGGIGNDQLSAGAGDDIYVFSTGDGADLIKDEGGKNTFYLASTFTPDTVAVAETTEGYLRLSFGGDVLYFDQYQALYESSFSFGDGTVLPFAELMRLMQTPLNIYGSESLPSAVGGAGADDITATVGGDTLIGNQGNDTLRGSDGDDVYQFRSGDGDDTLIDSSLNSDGSVARNVIRFASDVQASSLSFDVAYSGDGTQSLKISYPGGSVTIPNGLFGSIASFQFADGSELSFVDAVGAIPGMQLVQSSTLGGVMYGSYSAEELYGGLGADTVYGRSGDDKIYGNEGDDNLHGEEGDDLLNGGAGNDLLDGGAGDDQLAGGAGDDVLRGGDGDDTLMGGKGNDILEGGAGTDTYSFHLGMQQDRVIDSNSQIDTIQISSFVDIKDLSTTRQGADLVIHTFDGSDSMIIEGYYDNPDKWKVALADGAPFPVAELIDQLANLPTNGLAYYAHVFESNLKAAFRQDMEANGYEIGADGKYHLDESWETQWGYSRSQRTASLSIEPGSATEPRIPTETAGLWVTSDQISNSDYQIKRWTIGSTLIQGGSKEEAPAYYPVGSNFTYDLNSTIVEKRDSAGNIVGHYVYGSSYAEPVSYKNFYYSEEETSYTYKVVMGEEGGQRVIVGGGNQFYGGGGDDVLIGSAQDAFSTTLGVFESGGAGDDLLVGSTSNDVLAGGSGDNLMWGGQGADTYVMDSTPGTDIISDFSTPWYDNGDELRGWHGLGKTDTSTDTVTLPDTITLDNIQVRWGRMLAEGVNYNYINEDVDQRSQEGQDRGAQWAAGRGIDALMAYTTLEISWGEGRTVKIIMPHADQPMGEGIEIIRFADGTEMSVNDLASRFGLGDAPDPSLTGAVIDTAGAVSPLTGERLTIAGGAGADTLQGTGTLQGWAGNDSLIGGDGDDTLDGGRGDDVLSGGAGNDVIRGGAGDDVIDGGAGDDIYAFTSLAGMDTIRSTGGGIDTLLVDDLGSLAPNSGGGPVIILSGDEPIIVESEVDDTPTIINVGGGNSVPPFAFYREGDDLLIVDQYSPRNQLRVEGQFASDSPVISYIRDQYGNQLTAEDISGLLSTTPLDIHDNLASDYLEAWGGNASLLGGGGNDSLTVYGGTAVMNGGDGDDGYTFFGGAAFIEESSGSDTVTFLNGSTIEDIQNKLVKVNDDLLIDFGNATGDTLTVKNFFVSATHQVELFQDEAGGTLTAEDIYALLGLALPNRSADFDNVIQDQGLTESVLNGTDKNELVQGFNDNDVLLGAEGDDRLEGGNGNDTLVGGAGNDILIGGRGNDVYEFSEGDGQDVIDNRGGGNDAIMVKGMSVNDFYQSFSQAGSDLNILRSNGLDSITIRDWFSGGDQMVSTFELSDGIVTADQVMQQLGGTLPMGYTSPIYVALPEERDYAVVSDDHTVDAVMLYGSSSDDLLIAGQGDDRLDGGRGNDYLVGGDGNDVYIFGDGYGQDTIDNYSNTPDAFDRLNVYSDLDKLWFSQSEDNLVITLLGSDDQVTLKDWFSHPSSQLGAIEVDGTQFDANQVNNLVTAMAAFGAPVGGDIALTRDQRAQLDYMLGVSAGGGSGGGIVS